LSKELLFTVTCELEQFERYKETGEKMLNSLRLK